MDHREVEGLPVDIRFEAQSDAALRDILHIIVSRRLDKESLTDLRNLFSVPNHIPDRQVEMWVVEWINRRSR